MQVSSEVENGRVPVTVMKVTGDVDAASYRDLLAAARAQYEAGARHILLDLGEVGYMGSSGLVALHGIAVLVGGQQPPDPEAGWRAFRTMGRDVEGGRQQGVKLLNPRPAVARVLETSGMAQFFEVFTDRAAAIAAFGDGT
jgi:anti-anti-sigma regulatory factor